MREGEAVIVGIAVAKAGRDMAIRPRGEDRHLAHAAAGIAEIVAWWQPVHPQLIVIEATGG
jgi:transposase